MNTFEVPVWQYMMPDGRVVQTCTDLGIEVQSLYIEMVKAGCRFEAEVLRTNEVSITISDPLVGIDLDCSITPNGPQVQVGMVEMLKRKAWQAAQREEA